MLTLFTRVLIVLCSFTALCVDPPAGYALDDHSVIPQQLTVSSSAMDALLHGPLLFRQNSGQWERKVLFRTNVDGAVASFLKDGISFGFYRNVAAEGTSEGGREQLVWNLRFAGSNPHAVLQGERAQEVRTTYIGADAGGVTSRSVPSYSQVYYRNLYDGIDLKYYGSGENLKYDYILRPGADAGNIRMECNGIAGLYISYTGDLQVMTPWGALTEKRPYAYQNIAGEQHEVDVRYELLNDTTFGFHIYGAYDTSRELVIDPVSVQWSTFVGGRGLGYLHDIVVDSIGNVYGTGWYSSFFPTTPGVFREKLGVEDNSLREGGILVFKLRHDGKALEYATYIGRGEGCAIAVNSKGEAYVAGSASDVAGEAPFPYTTSAYQNSQGGNLFVLKLNPSGTQLQYCAQIGFVESNWNNYESIDMALDTQGQPVITGETAGGAFPVTTVMLPDHQQSRSDIFVCKLNADGSQIVFSTLIGGSRRDAGSGIRLTTSGEIVLIGNTRSTDFPTTPGALQASYKGNDGDMGDIVVLRLDSSATRLLASTYIGGIDWDTGTDVEVSASGDIYITGCTYSSDFPVTPKAYSKKIGSNLTADIILVKLSNDLSAIKYSTCIGTKEDEYASSMALNALGEVYLVGYTVSKEFPTANNSLITRCGRGTGGDYIVAKISADASKLLFSFCLGNDYSAMASVGCFAPFKTVEYCTGGIASLSLMPSKCSANLAVSVLTSTAAIDASPFPTTELVFQPYPYNKEFQPAILMIAEKTEIRAEFQPVINCQQFEFVNTSASTDDGRQLSWLWDFGDGETSNEKQPVHIYAQPGSYKVSLTVKGCEASSIVTALVTTRSITITASGDATVCPHTPVPLKVELSGPVEGTPVMYRWEPAMLVDDPSSPTPIATPDKSTTFIVTVTTTTGCIAIDSVTVQTFPFPLVEAGPDATICKSQSVRIGKMQSATGTYTWTPAIGLDNPSVATPLATPEVATTYILQYSDGRCTGYDTIVVTVRGNLVVEAGRDTTICIGQSVRLGSTAGEGTYLWTPEAGLDDPHSATPIATPGQTTTYIVFHTAGLCTGYDTVVVTVMPPPLVDAGPDIVACIGESIRLQGSSEGISFSWTPSEGMDDPTSLTPTIFPDQTTVYTLTVLNSLGCSSSDTVAVTVKSLVSIAGATEMTICEGDSVVLQATGGEQYRWLPQEGLSDATSARPTASPKTTTRYIVELLDSRCPSSDTVMIHVLPAPPVTVSNDTTICFGESIQLYAQGAEKYVWAPSDGLSATDIANPIARPHTTTMYVVQATDERGCTVRDSVNVSVRQPQRFLISIDELSAPVGDTLTIPVLANIDNGTLVLPVLKVRIRYDLRLLNILGVSNGQISHVVTNEQGILDIELHDVQVSGRTVLTEIHCGSLLSRTTETALEVDILTEEACVQMETRNGKFTRGPICAGGYDVGLLKLPQLHVYPVPAGDQVQVHISDMQEESRVQLYDLYGRLVIDQSLQPREEQLLTLDVGHLGAGTYTLIARSASATISNILYIVR